MKITVQGLWHLGSVTAGCCSQYFPVIGFDEDIAVVKALNKGTAPIYEPGLNELIVANLEAGSLSFSTDPKSALASADILWLCYDTPVNEEDIPDVNYVLDALKKNLQYLRTGTTVLISSQLPVGTCAKLEQEFPQFYFACSPENLRLGAALKVFNQADRFIVGIRNDHSKKLLENLFAPFTSKIIFMKTESAEMLKHALNSFLAASITFINEIATLCENVGADAKEVSEGLKSDIRIGSKAYLSPGGAIAGGTLARDVVTIIQLAKNHQRSLELISAIKKSNDHHRNWMLNRLTSSLENFEGKSIAIIGLTYKPGTNTLRRSAALELAQALEQASCKIKAFDPMIQELPAFSTNIHLVHSVSEALAGVDALVVCTEWPEFHNEDWIDIIPSMRNRLVIDANGFLEKELKHIPMIRYYSVGRL